MLGMDPSHSLHAAVEAAAAAAAAAQAASHPASPHFNLQGLVSSQDRSFLQTGLQRHLVPNLHTADNVDQGRDDLGNDFLDIDDTGSQFAYPVADLFQPKRGRGRPRKHPAGEPEQLKQKKKDRPPVPTYVPLRPPSGYTTPGNCSKSVHQKAALNRLFSEDQTPRKEMVREMVMKTGLDYREILKWFVGQRSIMKRKTLEGKDGNGFVHFDEGKSLSKNKRDRETENDEIKIKGQSTRKGDDERENSLKRGRGRPRTDPSGLSKSAAKSAREWACQYSLVDDPAEKEYMIHQMVDQLNVKRRKELRDLLVKESLGLQVIHDFKVRKSAADPSLTRDALIERADHVWEYMKTRFGATQNDPEESECLDDEGNILLDAAMVSGLEAMFSRHRDYFISLVYRFDILDMFREQMLREAKADSGETKASKRARDQGQKKGAKRRKMNQ